MIQISSDANGGERKDITGRKERSAQPLNGQKSALSFTALSNLRNAIFYLIRHGWKRAKPSWISAYVDLTGSRST